ncbi:prophage antirepressor [Anopheles sinensis]|uniref:Prophage antirepressor n=1 Tax=Anopheles sinensis TaxID=74873 RepID=A0A084VF70_ANOSI|nr:prophage antirepressor [Anopheles sinensis]
MVHSQQCISFLISHASICRVAHVGGCTWKLRGTSDEKEDRRERSFGCSGRHRRPADSRA